MRILIAEDNQTFARKWTRGILTRYPDAEIVRTATVKTAEAAFVSNPAFDLILMDGCLNAASTLDTLELVVKIHERCKAFILAVSGGEYANERLVDSGCNRSVQKRDALLVILHTLETLTKK